MSTASSRSRHRKPSAFSKSLCCLLQAVLNKKICIELRNDDEVRGTLTHVDAKMNLNFSTCTLKPVQRRAQRLDSLYVAGRSVRYIHFPDEIDLTQALADHVRCWRWISSCERVSTTV